MNTETRIDETGKICCDRLREEVVEHYGGKCIFCQESDCSLLMVQHFDNLGKFSREEQREIPGEFMNEYYGSIKGRDYPVGFVVICCDCEALLHKYNHQRITK